MKLTFSAAKRKVMCLKGRLPPPYTVRMDGKRLSEVTEMNYLGATIDDRWKRLAGMAAPMFQRIRRIVGTSSLYDNASNTFEFKIKSPTVKHNNLMFSTSD